ncbi:hypothetical protein B0H10DRAFT_2444318 [Mycena sp. CBHHK59/15]|nr:hypothetical protein B0H10DRAFT_2444318 [Mycena sp. CBHHK59/15]
MSLKTGILPNPNNELSHRMARSTQHHSSTMRKANKSREAADISTELRLQIEAEAEKRCTSNLATKSLKAQLKAAKDVLGKREKSGEMLSASSSGRVKTPRTRAAPQTPVDAMQSDNTSAPVSATPAAPSLPELATDSVFGSLVTAAASLPEFSSVGLAIDSTFNFLGDFTWNLDVSTYSSNFDSPDISGLFVQDVQNSMLSTYDPTFFGLATDNGNAVIPSNFDMPAVDPLDDFFVSYGFMGSSTDFGATINPDFASAGPLDLPMLPLPPPESLSPAVRQSSEPGPSAPRSHCSRQEVDVGNILHTARPRAPSKQFAEYEDVSGRPQKKGKSKKVQFLTSFSSVVVSEFFDFAVMHN